MLRAIRFAALLFAALMTTPAWPQSPLDNLDRGKLLPIEKDESSEATVAIAKSDRKSTITACAFSSTGRFVMANDRGEAFLFDLTGAEAKPLPFPADKKFISIKGLAFTVDGKFLAVAGAGGLGIYEMTADGAKLMLSQVVSANAISFHPSGVLAASGFGGDGALYAVSAKGLVKLPIAIKGAESANAFSKDGGFLAAHMRNDVSVWKIDGTRCVPYAKVSETGGGTIRGFAISPDGKFLATSNDARLIVVKNLAKSEIKVKIDADPTTKYLWFTPDGARLVTASVHADNGPTTTVKVWNLTTGEAESSSQFKTPNTSAFNPGSSGNVSAAAISPDGQYVAVSNHSNAAFIVRATAAPKAEIAKTPEKPAPGVPLIEPASGAKTVEAKPAGPSPFDKLDPAKLPAAQRPLLPDATVAIVQGELRSPIRATALSSTGRLATCDVGGIVHLWDLTGTEPKELPFPKDKELIAGGTYAQLRFSPDGKLLAVHKSTHLQLFEMTPGGAKFLFDQKVPSTFSRLHFHPSGEIATSGRMFAVTPQGLDPITLQFRGAQGHNEFSKDGKLFASIYFTQERNGDRFCSEVMFWKIDPAKISEASKITEERSIQGFALSPDAKLLAASLVTNKIHLWDVSTDRPAFKRKFEAPWMRNLWFTADGERLIGAEGSKVGVWNVASGQQEKGWNWKVDFNSPYSAGTMGSVSAAALSADGRYLALSPHANGVIVMRLTK